MKLDGWEITLIVVSYLWGVCIGIYIGLQVF